ncbi:MAG: MFS transporter [Proteobacteria bacterium]|nr:MFS transporter [Pseudomonadota bacterium]
MPPARKPHRPTLPAASRACAGTALEAVLRKGRNLAEALDSQPAFTAMSVRDRAFTRLLLLTTLRRLGQIDNAIDGLLEKPLPARRAPVRDILRLGAAQLLFLNTPPHAAVDGAVALTAQSRHAALKGLVNALLRRLARDGAALLVMQDAARLNTSDWLWQSWTACYGEERCRAIAMAHMTEPPIDLSFKQMTPDWSARLGGEAMPGDTLRLKRAGAVDALDGYAEGAWWVQDIAAALPAKLLGAVSGQHIIEIGAAPGGKTAQLAAAGAHVQALDRSPARLARLRQNLERLGLPAEIIKADGETWRPQELADGLLLDAPCSATGTIRRHPDIMWRRQPKDVAELVGRQARMLQAAIKMIKPGGLLVYAVCSLELAEGPEQIENFLATGAPAERVVVTANEALGLAEALTPAGDLRTLPCHLTTAGGMDGFYAARLRRTF